MHTSDHDAFVAILDEQATVFGKKKPADELVKAYWTALKDLAISTIRECANRHMRFGKYFPKPFELRPHEDKPPVQRDAASEAKFEAALKFSTESWEILKRDNPDLYRARLREAVLARLEVLTHESSPAFDQIRREAGQAASERLNAGIARW